MFITTILRRSLFLFKSHDRLTRENEELRKEAEEEGQKYHRLMQGIVEAQEQRVRLETLLEQEKSKHREAVETSNDHLQQEFDAQMKQLKDTHQQKHRDLELQKQKLEYESANYQKEIERQQQVIDAKSKEIRMKDKELAQNAASGSVIKPLVDPTASTTGNKQNSPTIQHALEIDHLRKKLADQTKRIEVLVCEKSALNLEIQNMSRRIDLESLGAEFREFAPRKVHAGIIKFDELCQQGLVYIQKTPNVRVCIFAYLLVALVLNVLMCGRFLLF